MRYIEFRDSVQKELRANRAGLTWVELRQRLKLARQKACPEWTKALEKDLGLKRVKGPQQALIWKL